MIGFIIHTLFFLTLIWICSGVILSKVKKLTAHLQLPTFSFSLLLLGTLTSIPEAAVAINSIALQTPEISLGNLIGGQVILLLGVVPLLALPKKGLHFSYPLHPKSMGIVITTIILPFLFLFDQTLTLTEAYILIGVFLFFILIFVVDLRREHLSMARQRVQKRRTASTQIDLLAILAAVGVVFYATNRLVHIVQESASLIGLHPFFASVLIVSVGTNIPEITLAVRSIFSRSKDAALGDYIGSAATNTLLAGLVVVASGSVRVAFSTHVLLIPIVGFLLFWWFAKTKRTLSRTEALILIAIAITFIIVSFLQELSVYR